MYLFDIINTLFLPAVIIGIIIFFVRRRKKNRLHLTTDKERYLQFALSKEDVVSQFFLLLSIFFFGITLIAFNRDFGNLFSWQTILLITSTIGLASSYYFKAPYLLFFGLIGVTSWWGAQAVEWTQGKDIKGSAIFAGLAFIILLFYLLGYLHERKVGWKRFTSIYFLLGIIPMTGILFFFSMQGGLYTLGEITTGSSFFESWQVTLSLFIFLTAIIMVMLYAIIKKLMSSFEFIAIFILIFLFGVIALLPQETLFAYGSYGDGLSDSGIVWAVIFNFAIFFELLGLIFSGYLRKEIWLINMGAFFLFLLIIVKYFDWFFAFLDKSIFFIGAGVLLFVVGWFMEKSRRMMLSNIKKM